MLDIGLSQEEIDELNALKNSLKDLGANIGALADGTEAAKDALTELIE